MSKPSGQQMLRKDKQRWTFKSSPWIRRGPESDGEEFFNQELWWKGIHMLKSEYICRNCNAQWLNLIWR